MATLSVAIVGAGIGGLTTALVLSRQGHKVTLIERRTGFTEVGAGLQLSPNASRLLIDLDLGPALSRVASEPDGVTIRSLSSGREIGGVALGPFMRQRYGAPYWVAHRADLQRVLLDAVRSRSTIRLVMGRNVDEIESGPSPTVTFASASRARETLSADLIVGADGLWSRVRQSLNDPAPPAFRGAVAWRATVERSLAPTELSGNRTGLWLGRRGHVVHYPIARGTLINVVAIAKSANAVEGWSAPGRREDLQAHYAKAPPLLRDLLARAPEWQCWSLFDRPAGRLVAGRVALLGDAAHPVLPYLAQGAALAIEDAAVLGKALADSPADLEHALGVYAAARQKRAGRVQAEARRNGQIYHSGPLMALGRNGFMRHLGPERMTMRYDWLYNFDASAQAR